MADYVGNIVHFILDQGPNVGTHRPAIVTSANAGTYLNMRVLVEPGDIPAGGPGYNGFLWRQGIVNDTTATAVGSWHAPE